MDVTFTRMVQVEFARITELLNITDEPPLTAVNEAELPQFENEESTGLASTSWGGNESVSVTCVSALSRSLFLIRILN